MSDPISALGTTATAQRSSTASIGDSMDSDMFMNLLVTQLKYQDPTKPTDSTEFLAQTAQFTMVEKLSDIAAQTEANAITSRNLGAASLVGKTISWLADDGTTKTGTVSAARLGTAGPVLTVGSTDVPFDLVSAVSSSSAPIASAPTTSTKTSAAPSDDA